MRASVWRRLAARVVAECEYWCIHLACMVRGPSPAVAYLRNPNPRVTVRLLRSLGAMVGEETTFRRSVLLDNVTEDEHSAGDLRHLRVGRRCYVGDGVFFDLAHEVVLNDDVIVSAQAAFVTHADCNRSPFLNAHFPRRCAPVHVGRGAWIGFRASLLAGVTVGEQSVVGAHALLRHDAESRAVYAGVPASKVRAVEATS